MPGGRPDKAAAGGRLRIGPLCVYYALAIHMRTNIDIDDDLLSAAMKATGLETKRATVEEALRALVVAHRRREALQSLAGIGWDGDLDATRRDKKRR